MNRYQPNEKSKELFELLDKLDQCNEDILYHATKMKSKRLDHIERNAIEIEKLAKEIQRQVQSMRRK